MNDLNVIFFGSAGTGKTMMAKDIAVEIISKSKKELNSLDFKVLSEHLDLKVDDSHIMKKIKNLTISAKEVIKNLSLTEEDVLKYRAYPLIETITFHQNYSYQDFIEGIFPETNLKGEIEYKVKDGVFKKLCNRAINNPEYNYVLLIDEINRGNISAIFGELFTLIEEDKRMKAKNEMSINLPYSKDEITGEPKKLKVPNNLYIIATMNTVDKSIAMIDIALRRRFKFVECMPDYEILKKVKIENSEIELDLMLKAMNDRITILKNEHHQIGQAYFLPKNFDEQNSILTFEELKNIFIYKIIPLLQEYFYDNWEAICAILNQSFKNRQNGILEIETKQDNKFLDEFKDLTQFKNSKVVRVNKNFNEKDVVNIYG